MEKSRSTAGRRLGTLAGVLALTGASLAGLEGAAAPSAEALTPPIAITADELPTWQTNGIVWALAEADGVVFAGGSFTTVRPPGAEAGTQEVPARNFVALDAATGEPIEGCDLSFTIGSGVETVRALEVSPDGETLYVGGRFGAVNGIGASSVAAIDIDTCTPVSFPVASSATVRSIAAHGDRVYLAGDFTSLNGQSRQYFGAVDTAGTLLNWVADGDEIGKAVDVTPDGQNVVLGGNFFTINGVSTHALAVVDADDASMVRSYPGFIHNNSTVQDLYIDETGIYTANEGTGGGVFDGRLAIELDTFDERWRDTCLGATQAVHAFEGVLYSGHHAHDCSSMGAFPNQTRIHLTAQSVDDPTMLGWFPDTNDGMGESIGPRVMTVSENHPGDGRDYLWVGGEFTRVNGAPQWGLTRFASEPDTGDPVTVEAYATSIRAGEIDVTWRSSLDLDDSLLTYRVYRDGGGSPIHTVQGSSVPWKRPQLSFTDTSVTPGQTYSYRISATDAAGNVSALSSPVTVTAASSGQPYTDAVLADDPLLYWRYNETSGNFASDASGDNNSGVHRGGPSRGITPPAVNGPDARGVGHDGTDSYTYSDTGFSSTNQFTLETWFSTETTSGGRLIGFGNRILQLSNWYDRHLYMRDDGRLTFGVYNGASRTITSPAAYNDGEWHHVAATLGTNGMRLYVDGTLVASNSLHTTAQNFGSTPGYWRVGGDRLNNWPSRPSSDFFQGRLDETAVYYSTLSAARIEAHYDAAFIPGDTVTEVTPVADTYVNEFAAGSAYGTHQQLVTRDYPGYLAYMRFEVPAAPSGQVLKSAALRLTLTTDSTAGSADDTQFVPATSAWDESTTWNTRPTLGSTVYGTISGATTPGGVYTVPLDTAEIGALLGSTLDMGGVGSGGDTLRWYSREASSGSQPVLVLTFGAP
ncbi:LamG-like jellyroll fold domain-containing protein [Streptomyces aidingensis]|uniref:Concanavalin A-like lectin/glucanases superfamily protein n=1 Tax=Streptomyces aidingensis TaxID=910347 RepID=A0A1I1LEA7_9ACTN|nr:LamG-like jellyroll fold domain-containing protein [Streptomyces aidingensis]SFC68713.1 Concanavalin A-like lectin/glucanases superfamily protein [Streptomyces aidingensis]